MHASTHAAAQTPSHERIRTSNTALAMPSSLSFTSLASPALPAAWSACKPASPASARRVASLKLSLKAAIDSRGSAASAAASLRRPASSRRAASSAPSLAMTASRRLVSSSAESAPAPGVTAAEAGEKGTARSVRHRPAASTPRGCAGAAASEGPSPICIGANAAAGAACGPRERGKSDALWVGGTRGNADPVQRAAPADRGLTAGRRCCRFGRTRELRFPLPLCCFLCRKRQHASPPLLTSVLELRPPFPPDKCRSANPPASGSTAPKGRVLWRQ
eukprot:350223-Chlamydomonas_euryale.AAC.3